MVKVLWSRERRSAAHLPCILGKVRGTRASASSSHYMDAANTHLLIMVVEESHRDSVTDPNWGMGVNDLLLPQRVIRALLA